MFKCGSRLGGSRSAMRTRPPYFGLSAAATPCARASEPQMATGNTNRAASTTVRHTMPRAFRAPLVRLIITSLIQPRRDHPVHHSMAYFRCEALQLRLMNMIGEPNGDIHIVRLVGHVALDVVDKALTLFGIQFPPLGEEHGIECGIIDMAAVVRLAGIEDAVQI